MSFVQYQWDPVEMPWIFSQISKIFLPISNSCSLSAQYGEFHWNVAGRNLLLPMCWQLKILTYPHNIELYMSIISSLSTSSHHQILFPLFPRLLVFLWHTQIEIAWCYGPFCCQQINCVNGPTVVIKTTAF